MTTVDSYLGLRPGERVIWEGRPVQRRIRLLYDGRFLLSGLFNLAIATLLVVAGAINGSWLFEAVAVLFVVLFLGLPLVQYVQRRRLTADTRYVVTTWQAIVVRGERTGMERLAALGPPVIRERADGSGDLGVGSMPGLVPAGYFSPLRGLRDPLRIGAGEELVPPVFRDIAQVRAVYDLVVSAQTAARSIVDDRTA
jgi:hypothetical protein